ncbi:Sulfotransferase family protein [Aliiroseovarius halocynthiae]|uniref:Sulfotransferase n=1 Tax=Aliiroseovarius halocynthiae TaxID=985055 RepID=A0A545SV82_9RHOB|nr:sulfotransferase [Aliiroseovarius halocynthiae]TQV68873.1 sulfotransferase [Aliiroseovarius halocynthiae]SMR71346.1 Sulfotransferase family protein [Aliiroseovarius halocynthiae]
MIEQTFIFCVGATKAGTSWLYDYLNSHRECQLPAVKELHYFDALEHGSGAWHRKQLEGRLEGVRSRLDAADSLNLHQERLLTDGEGWLNTFDGETRDDDAYLQFVRNAAGDAKLIGDFTPAYGMLKEATFRTMAGLTDKVRFVFLMRDPVERIWSNIRMIAGQDGPATLEAKIKGVLDGTATNILERSNYRRTLNRLSAAMPTEMFHIEYYERLFTPDAISRLCAFLGITHEPAQFERVVHRSAPADLPAAQRAQLQTALKPQYNFVEKFMGELPTEWTQKMVSV